LIEALKGTSSAIKHACLATENDTSTRFYVNKSQHARGQTNHNQENKKELVYEKKITQALVASQIPIILQIISGRIIAVSQARDS